MENKKEYRNWLDQMNLDHPLVIAGPCSAETEEQVLKIAHELKDSDVTAYRAGIWKPRTRPGMFEGVGAIGLKWLQKVKKETGLMIATEVANSVHVDLALEHDVDILWIGARSTVSPFIVQEIADALKGTDKIVLIKNPVNPDLSLWMGGVERIYSADIKNIGVIHRGFSSYDKSKYRNNPEWQIAVEFQNNFPDIPLICDPSHIAGRRDLIFDLSQTSLDLNYDGLMIESHWDPDNAWSDAAQQVTPERLIEIMRDLKIRDKTSQGEDYQNRLNNLRSQIDAADQNLLTTLGKRMEVAKGIGKLKSENNVAILQNKRWNEILGKMILDVEEERYKLTLHGLNSAMKELELYKAYNDNFAKIMTSVRLQIQLLAEDSWLKIASKSSELMEGEGAKIHFEALTKSMRVQKRISDEKGFVMDLTGEISELSADQVLRREKFVVCDWMAAKKKWKAKKFKFSLKGAVMASDSFFPFPDCVEIASKNGIKSVIQPGGSIKDKLSIDFCNNNSISMVMTGNRHFKH